jgi:putative FmdB family regulatory protein
MPLYEYYCTTCENRFELLRSLDRGDARDETCPAGHPGAKKVLSVFATVTSGGDSGMDMSDAGCGHCGSATPGACSLD